MARPPGGTIEPAGAVFLRALQCPPDAVQASRWGWRACYAVLVLAGATVGLLRLVVGLRAVYVMRGRGEPIDDQRLRDDDLSGMLAPLSLALHFDHPLAPWLPGRLRLQQESAAGSRGARLAGGQSLFLTLLAQMALRQADRPVCVGWPA